MCELARACARSCVQRRDLACSGASACARAWVRVAVSVDAKTSAQPRARMRASVQAFVRAHACARLRMCAFARPRLHRRQTRRGLSWECAHGDDDGVDGALRLGRGVHQRHRRHRHRAEADAHAEPAQPCPAKSTGARRGRRAHTQLHALASAKTDADDLQGSQRRALRRSHADEFADPSHT
eukprot:6174588-Pleurochrysis_carterae.AAC.1